MDYELIKRRHAAYQIFQWDDYQRDEIAKDPSMKDIIDIVVSFFKLSSQFYQPYKSYFVAIIYAHCMEKYFNIPWKEALDDKELLFDDRFFVTYSENKIVYDTIVDIVGNIWQYKSIKTTVDYFKKEFLIVEKE